LFQRNQYYAYDILSGQGDPGYPRLMAVSGGWPGLWSSPPHVTAAFVWPMPIDLNWKAFFFQNDLFAQVNVVTRTVDPGFPKLIQGNWPGL
jgi:Hemopexin